MIDKILNRVTKPTRYTGGELNSASKKPADVRIRYAFCFPDSYEVGMSHLGLKILYHLLNSRDDTFCERVFAPWPDMQAEMEKENIPLWGLESQEPIKNFDFVGFTLQYEMCYSNVLLMLRLAGIPLLASERGEDDPFVYAGGPCTYNPEPVAEFFDFFAIGEGEESTMALMDEYLRWKDSGESRREFLLRVARLDGFYVPSLYDVTYAPDGRLASMTPNCPEAPARVKKCVVKDLDNCFFPDKFIVPFTEVIHDRIMLEVFRGCIRGCRFCQAGQICRPVREKSPATLLSQAKALIESTGYEEMSLTSLSTSDYTCLRELTESLIDMTTEKKVSLSLPSLRVDNFSLNLMEKVQKVRRTGLTFAPEAGTQRMRDIINKGVTEEDLLHSASLAFSGGWTSLKLYFMLGLPYETTEDCVGIAELCHKVVDEFYKLPKEKRARGVQITASASSFVPKPFTPFQWAEQADAETLRARQKAVRESLHARQVRFNWHESDLSVLEGVFARGDRRLSKVLLKASELGCRFDAWDEWFLKDKWDEAFAACGIDPREYTRARDYDELLPWDVIDPGVSKAFLLRESEKASRGETSPNCREGCSGCGANQFIKGGVCFG